MIPEGWSIARIEDLGEVQAGRQRAPQYSTGHLRPYLRVANVFDGFIDTTDVLQMAFSDKEFERYRLSPGDILLNEGQSLELVGRSAIYEGQPAECCFQNTLIRFRAGEGVDSVFAHILFQQMQYKGIFAQTALQTTSVAHLGVSRFASLSVLMPQAEEQRKIANVLSVWTKGISLTKRLIDCKRVFRRALMRKLLVGDDGNPFYRRGWTSHALGDLFTERNESQRPDLPLLSITADRGVVPRASIDRRDSSSEDKRPYKRIAPGDIGYNTMRMWQGVSALSALEGIVSPAYTVCIPGNLIDGHFASYLFKLPHTIDLFYRYSQGLVDDTLSLKFTNFSKIRVSIPPIETQKHIATVLSLVDREIQLLRNFGQQLDFQKRQLMEKLLSGEIRVDSKIISHSLPNGIQQNTM